MRQRRWMEILSEYDCDIRYEVKVYFGPLHALDKRVILADDTWKQTRGLVKDVMIQLGEFFYPVDFLVLGYAPTGTNEQQMVILGRPFLHTANAQINYRQWRSIMGARGCTRCHTPVFHVLPVGPVGSIVT